LIDIKVLETGGFTYATKSGNVTCEFRGIQKNLKVKLKEVESYNNTTFAPVMHFPSLRLILSIAAIKNYDIDHVYVKTAFLNGKLNEEVYMRQPIGYEEDGKENWVCKLKRTIRSQTIAIRMEQRNIKFPF
jgi:hypothetical protein